MTIEEATRWLLDAEREGRIPTQVVHALIEHDKELSEALVSLAAERDDAYSQNAQLEIDRNVAAVMLNGLPPGTPLYYATLAEADEGPEDDTLPPQHGEREAKCTCERRNIVDFSGMYAFSLGGLGRDNNMERDGWEPGPTADADGMYIRKCAACKAAK